MANRKRTVRTTVSLPASLYQRMKQSGTNWSAFVREAIRARLEEETEPDMTEAVILTERLRRPAPPGWDSTAVVNTWRQRH